MRKLSVSREYPPAPSRLLAQIPLSIRVVSPFLSFSAWISRAATREISGLVVSGDEDDVRRRRDQHVPTALPSGNYGKPRLSEELTLAHPLLSLSLSLAL